MSRLWADRLAVGLTPTRVELLRIPFAATKRQALARSIECQPGKGEPAWRAALDALAVAAPDYAARATDVTVVVSNHFARYLVVPWKDEIATPEELDAFARHCFGRDFGTAAEAWEVACAPAGYRAPGLACAIDRALLEKLRAVLGQGGMRVVSVQPLLVSAYNRMRRQIAGDGAWAVVEPGRLCLGVFAGGQWRHVASRRATGDDAAAVIEQELAAAGVSGAAPLDVLNVGCGAGAMAQGARPARTRVEAAGEKGFLAAFGAT